MKTLTKTSADNHAINSNYSCIVVTNSDISLEWSSIKNSKREEKLKSNIFLISPLIENTNEYQKYFETMVDTIGTKSDQPLISEYAKSTKTIDVSNMSVSAMTKAVWVLSEAYQVFNKPKVFFKKKSFCKIFSVDKIDRIYIENNVPEIQIIVI